MANSTTNTRIQNSGTSRNHGPKNGPAQWAAAMAVSAWDMVCLSGTGRDSRDRMLRVNAAGGVRESAAGSDLWCSAGSTATASRA
ncbi:hypothetical protein GCM10022240_22080 [Microbacterium kribbense]|uniref:Uncharacterized protein n=1 Tax=Microbacterium kribbense TaxID=433645 RepID=A0ABP7GMK7_9MICO